MTGFQGRRVVELNEEINTDSATRVIGELIALDEKDHVTPIELSINSPGGSIFDALAIMQAMYDIKAPVYTTCSHMCIGAAAMVFAGGRQGNRSATPNAFFMFPDVAGGVSGNEQEVRAGTMALQGVQRSVTAVFAGMTHHSAEEAAEIFGHGKTYSADQARQAGLVDQIRMAPA